MTFVINATVVDLFDGSDGDLVTDGALAIHKLNATSKRYQGALAIHKLNAMSKRYQSLSVNSR